MRSAEAPSGKLPRSMRRLLVILLLLSTAAPARADRQRELALRALRDDPSLKVRSQAAIILGQRGAREAIPALAEAAARDEAPAVRVAAVAALGHIGDASARPALEAAQRDPDASVRAAAVRALAESQASAPAPAPAPAAPRARRASPLAFSIEPTSGAAGDDDARAALRDAIARHLKARGHSVVAGGGTYVLRPSVLKVDVSSSGADTVIAVKASLVAVDGAGRLAAMLEGGARLRAAGGVARSAVPGYAARALDAAARTLCDDLAAQLR